MPVIQLSPVIRRYVIATVLCVIVASIGVLKRHWETKDVLASVEQAQAIGGEAGAIHKRLFREYQKDSLSNDELAESLERETIPRWEKCVSLMEACRAQGLKGGLFEDLNSYYTLRLSATESLVEALNLNDRQLLGIAQSRWKEANQVAGRLELRRMMAKSDRFHAPELSLR